MESLLITAGGKIVCLRCMARSSVTGKQCGRPAVKTSKSQKCIRHGGLSSGPKTEAGKQRIREANWRHGERSAAAVDRASETLALIRQCCDALRILGAITGSRPVGRPPNYYVPLRTLDDVRRFAAEQLAQNARPG
jgi:hypothetical protein